VKATQREWEKVFQDIDTTDSQITLFNERDTLLRNRLIKIFHDFFRRDGLTLDGGCGEGEWCFALDESGYRTIGIDIVPEAIKHAQRIKNHNRAESIFLIGDVTWLPIRDNVLGGYISLGLVEHFRYREDVNRAIEEAGRSLIPGGRGFFALPGLLVCLRNSLSLWLTKCRTGIYHRYISKGYMEGLIEEAKLKLLESRYEEGWMGLNNLVDGIIKKLGSRKIRERSNIFWSNLKPVWFFSGNYFWTEKTLE
jgi:SAM-dependent methyltransferase